MPSKKPPAEEAEVTLEQVQVAASQAINQYFTPEVNQRMNELTNDQMIEGLKSLEGSIHWIPILKYVQQRLLMAQTQLNTLDPNVQATSMARTQGIMTGLTDIQNIVITLVETERQMAEETERMRNEEVI